MTEMEAKWHEILIDRSRDWLMARIDALQALGRKHLVARSPDSARRAH